MGDAPEFESTKATRYWNVPVPHRIDQRSNPANHPAAKPPRAKLPSFWPPADRSSLDLIELFLNTNSLISRLLRKGFAKSFS
jgi:hypothetical protein